MLNGALAWSRIALMINFLSVMLINSGLAHQMIWFHYCSFLEENVNGHPMQVRYLSSDPQQYLIATQANCHHSLLQAKDTHKYCSNMFSEQTRGGNPKFWTWYMFHNIVCEQPLSTRKRNVDTMYKCKHCS